MDFIKLFINIFNSPLRSRAYHPVLTIDTVTDLSFSLEVTCNKHAESPAIVGYDCD